jgi:APA family basic amino acid/polyamine antiporter
MGKTNIRQWFAGVWHDATLKIDIEESHGGGDKLIRQMGLFSVILFTITSAVGSGILTTPGIIARQYAGPNAWMSFVQAGMICLCPALCLAYMASRTAKSGSTGSYACLVLGQLPGLLMFVDVMMECIGGTAAVAVSQSDHIKMIVRLVSGQWFGHEVKLPEYFTTTPTEVNWLLLLGATIGGTTTAVLFNYGRTSLKTPRGSQSITSRGLACATIVLSGLCALFGCGCTIAFVRELPSINFLSMGVVLIITVVLLRGVKETAFLTNVFTLTKLVVLGVVILFLARHYDPANLVLPVPDNLPGALAGASVAFFAFVGLDLATTTAGEVKNSKRNVPIGMLIGLACVTVLYFLAAYFLCAAVPYYKLGAHGEGEAAPMVQALELLGYTDAAIYVGLGSTVALVSVVLASAYATTRLLFNMAQHGLMPKVFEQVSEKRQVPVLATLVVGGGISLLTGLMAVGELMHLTNIGTMTAFITISLTVLVLTVRETEWKTRRGLLTGMFWLVVAILGIIGPARLMMELPWEAFARLVAVWSLVLVLFVTYSRKHSLARKQANGHDEKDSNAK